MGRSARLGRVREICLGCIEGAGEVRACGFFGCPLWAFRMGKNPFPASAARREASRKAVLAARAALGLSAPVERATASEMAVARGVPELGVLRSWAGRNLPMGSVASPDPREMTGEELAALGCVNRSVTRALWLNERQNEMAYEKRRALGLQAAVPSAWAPEAGRGVGRKRGRGKD
jgi:hypothetical protein